MNFSKRTAWAMGPNPLAQALSAKLAQGVKVLDLTESNPTRCSFGYLTPSLLSSLQNPANLTYEPNAHGLPLAREAVCRYYADKKIKISPEHVFLTASTSEAYSFLFKLLVDADESVLAPTPSYPLFDYLSQLSDAILKRYPLNHDKGWHIDRERFFSAYEKSVKAVMVVNPNNPTGNFVKPDEREMLNRFCRDKRLAIIADEVFHDFSWDATAAQPESFAGNKEVLTFTLSGVSKILGLPQMKLSWIVVSGPSDLRKKAIERLEIIADTYLSVNTPSQHALPRWLAARGNITGEITKRLLFNRAYLEAAIKNTKIGRLLLGEGGWYAVLEMRAEKSDEELALELLEKYNVLVHPGYFFDFDGGNYLVLSLLPEPGIFKEGIDRLFGAVI